MSLPAALGLRAQKGGAVVVALAVEASEPRLLLSTFLATAAEGDRLALEPYHVAAEMERGANGESFPEIEAAVAEGRKRQEAQAVVGLATILRRLEASDGEPRVAALLTNRAGWVTDLVAYSLAFADHPPVAEGLAVRDALRAACSRLAVPMVEMDEKSLRAQAAAALALAPAEIDARLKTLGAPAGQPWRKEQKLACLAAWSALQPPHA